MSSNKSSRHLLCVVASVVVKSRNPHMCITVQAMVSILMYTGHPGKQVCLCTILLNGHYIYSPHARSCSTDYRNLVCAYHNHISTINDLSYMYNHDDAVIQWRDRLLPVICVNIFFNKLNHNTQTKHFGCIQVNVQKMPAITIDDSESFD